MKKAKGKMMQGFGKEKEQLFVQNIQYYSNKENYRSILLSIKSFASVRQKSLLKTSTISIFNSMTLLYTYRK